MPRPAHVSNPIYEVRSFETRPRSGRLAGLFPDGHQRRPTRIRARPGVVERTVSWLLRRKRLGLRYDRTEATLRPLVLATSTINLRRLVQVTEF